MLRMYLLRICARIKPSSLQLKLASVDIASPISRFKTNMTYFPFPNWDKKFVFKSSAVDPGVWINIGNITYKNVQKCILLFKGTICIVV